MRICETLPPPEVVAREIVAARRERVLLRRLYRLALDARAINREYIHEPLRPADDNENGGEQ